MPDHKGFKLQQPSGIHPLHFEVNFRNVSLLSVLIVTCVTLQCIDADGNNPGCRDSTVEKDAMTKCNILKVGSFADCNSKVSSLHLHICIVCICVVDSFSVK